LTSFFSTFVTLPYFPVGSFHHFQSSCTKFTLQQFTFLSTNLLYFPPFPWFHPKFVVTFHHFCCGCYLIKFTALLYFHHI
jgi:hypothetical protein